MFELTDESLVIFEQIVGGKVHSVSYNPKIPHIQCYI